ncbi:MAG: lamin tail domain-containing protein, partial [Sedimentisphaerales bacterium]|nr:lamin tail domain-containing protein [Sedimentisphaerales bacterium]
MLVLRSRLLRRVAKEQMRSACGGLVMICAVVLCATRPGMGLVVSEVMYHPVDQNEALEFIELYNNRAVSEDVSGYEFTSGIEYKFQPGTVIGPKAYLVVARDPNAMAAAYPDLSTSLGTGLGGGVHGPFTGRLSNDGERIDLSNANGAIVISVRYSDEAPWPASPDGTGHSLILAKLGGDPEEASTWSPSTYIGGTPGGPDQVQVGPKDPTVVILVDVGHAGRYFKGTKEPSPSLINIGQATTAWTELQFNDDPSTTTWRDGPSGY